jgi:predicted esterase
MNWTDILRLVMVATLVACGGAGDDTGLDTSEDSGTSAVVWEEAPAYSGGDCPVLEDGVNKKFLVDGVERKFRLLLPENPIGAPVIFAWHWLGGTAQQVVNYMDYEQLVADEGVIVVAPTSDGSPYEWHVSDQPDDNIDIVFFDDMVSCLYDQYQIDPNRIHATGMSAGGIWTTYLTIFRSNILASTAPLSGGVYANAYVSPERALPVLVVWGGPNDTYGTFNFETASNGLSEGLRADGSFVVECVHDNGHSLPNQSGSFTWEFFKDHPYGVAPEPYADGLPPAMPNYCYLPE